MKSDMKSGTAVGVMILAVGLLAAVQPAVANNIAVTNVALQNQTVGAQTVDVQFDLGWDNSWRSAATDPAYTNWDAAWVFVKVKDTAGNWQPATLSTNRIDHTAAANSTIDPAFDGTGVFVYRSGDLSGGTVAYTGTRLRWNYGLDSYRFAAGTVVTVSVQAIEMVYVPQGSFYVGSGSTNELGSFTDGAWGGTPNATIPFRITNEAALLITNAAGNLWSTSTNGNSSIGVAGTLSPAFPKGYNAFYCMKYELTQGQYTDFLNKLTATQAGNLYSSASTGQRYTIGTNSVGVFTNGAPDRACNFLSWADGLAYADWAGLRPMTELEFEKACRGPATSVTNEYAWGSTNISATTAIVNDGTGTDTATGGNCNYGSCSPDGPFRVGIYATVISSRTQAGATYWGIMDMSGSLTERPVSVGTTASRLFTGLHGNGKLTSDGIADVSNWPTDGAGIRGGDWYGPSESAVGCQARVSDRSLAALNGASALYRTYDHADIGWRGVRTAP